MPPLAVNLFGGFEVCVEARGPIAISAVKARALLAYLARRPGQGHSRDKLATLLWEGSDDAQARSSLRQALATLRRALAPLDEGLFVAAGDMLSLKADAVRVDVCAFERLVADGTPESLEAAVALHRGEFLEGFNPKAPGFDDWLAMERQELREAALDALRRLLGLHLDAGRTERALQVALRLLSIDPLQEPVHRSLMMLYVRHGQQAAALKQYHACRALLQRELGIAPEPETNRLYKEILRQRQHRGGEEPSPDASPEREAPAAEPDGAAPLPPELRQATVLFAAVADSAELGHALGPEDMGDLLNRCFEVIDAVVEAYGGTVTAHVGDTVMAMFGVPSAHSNDAERAVRAALDIHRFIADLEAGSRGPLRLRIGLASGRVVAGELGGGRHRERTVTGEPVTLAARLSALAEAGETLISGALHRGIAAAFDCEPAGAAASGSAGPDPAWRVRALRPEPDLRAASRFVGREVERRQFAGAIGVAAETRCGQIVFVRGEAGIGKTRLVAEFAAMAEAKGFASHKGLVLDFGVRSSENAIRALVRSLLDIPVAADVDRRRALAEQSLSGELDPEHRVFLNDLLDLPQPPELRARYEAMDNAARNRGKCDLIADLVRAKSARRPLLLIVEDIHWAEGQVLVHLANIAAAVKTCPALLVMTSRSDGDPLDAAWRTSARGTPLTTIDLGPLQEHEARMLADQHADADADFACTCVRRAEGNPLFLEQLLQSGGDADDIPGSVQSIVLARVDRLRALDRQALQAASVLGQRFASAPLRHLIEDPDYTCAELVRQVLVQQEGDGYLFAHALIRDSVYGSLLRSQRQALHRRAAEWFAGTDPVLYAEHLDRADDPAAAPAYLQAARAQAAEYRYERALRLAERGLDLAGERQVRFELTCFCGDMLRDLGLAEASIEAFQRALELAAGSAEESRVWIGIAGGMRLVDRYRDALDALHRAERAATQCDGAQELARIHYLRGNIYFPLGDIDGCLGAHERALGFAREAGSPRNEARALGGLGDAYYQRGRMVTAHGYFQRCIELARAHGFGRIEVSHLYMAAATRVYANELPGAIADAEAAVEAAARIGHLRAELLAHLIACDVLFEMAEIDRVRPHVERTLALARRLRAGRFEANALTYAAMLRCREGQGAEAEALLSEALALSRKSGHGYFGPRILVEIAKNAAEPEARRSALQEAERILRDGCVGHNYLHYYRHAMDVALEVEEWDDVLRAADALEDYCRAEPLPWSGFFAARGRALAAWGRGARDEATRQTLERLRREAEGCRLNAALPAIAAALDEGAP